MTMLSSGAIRDALRQHGEPGSSGRGAFLRRIAERSRANLPNAPLSQRQLGADLETTPSTRPPLYDHPGKTQGNGTLPPGAVGTGPLTDADMLWLSRLPADPAAVTHADSRILLGLANRKLEPDQARLINSIADPVREIHDLAAARANLAAAQPPPAHLPPSALPALAASIQNEVPALTPGEALGRAQDHLDAITRDRVTEHAQRLANAQRTLDDVLARQAARTQTTRIVPTDGPA